MFVSIITLIFTNFLVIIYAQPDEILRNSETTREEAAQKLVEIQPSQALPAVLFEVGNRVHLPKEINEAWIVDGKMVNGTKFSLLNLRRPIFFCPKPFDPSFCLVPQEFQDLHELKCSQEPTPILTHDHNVICGRGTPNSVVYLICEGEGPYRYQYQYIEMLLGVYGFCFDHQEGKTLYTSHFILSPKLLQSNLLFREQQLSYDLVPALGYETANADEIANSLYWDTLLGVGDGALGQDYRLQQLETLLGDRALGPDYRLQQLVPSKNMAFGYMRKTTFLYLNYQLQHRDLFDLWNDMNEKVRIEAIRAYEIGFNFHINTGVFDLSSNIPENVSGTQIYNMWVTLIISQSQADYQQMRGVVILMNNFINADHPTPDVEELQNEIDEKHCRRSFCSIEFQRKVARIGVVARCCKTTEPVMDLFGIGSMDLPLIGIPGVV